MKKINKNFGIILIVRLKSKRLLNKAILKINKDENSTEYLIEKLKKNFLNSKIILCTSQYKKDHKLIEIAKKKKINFYCGEPVDVLKRIFFSSIKFNFKNVFVCTGDNPLIDVNTTKKLVNFHILNKNDFTESEHLPIGSYGYCIKVSSLKKIISQKKTKNTEIWGGFFKKNKTFRCKKKKFYKYSEYENLRLTLDYRQDYLLIKKILKISKYKYPSLDQIIKIWKKNKNIFKINKYMYQKKKTKFI